MLNEEFQVTYSNFTVIKTKKSCSRVLLRDEIVKFEIVVHHCELLARIAPSEKQMPNFKFNWETNIENKLRFYFG